MRAFLTFLSLFTLLFFLSPVLCLSVPAEDTPETEILFIPERIPRNGVETSVADLILGAVAAMDLRGYGDETLKAAAVIAATNLSGIYADTGTGDGLAILTPEEAKTAWGEHWFSVYWPQMQQAVRDTWGELLTKDGKRYTEAAYFPVSWGKTEIGVECPYDETSNDYHSEVTVPLKEFTAVFPEYSASLAVKNAQSGRVETVTSGNTVLTGAEMMKTFSLPSPAFTVTVNATAATFRCRGVGDGIGMSLYGANEMAKQGYGYREILKTFYPETDLQEANRSLGSR